MITKDNFKKVLASLGFEADIYGIYSRKYGDAIMSVNFQNKRLVYPKDRGLKVHDETTSNFEHDENFVVFECVCRLLEKGYRAEHIELEPRWVVGHGASGGKADILVRDGNKNSYIIIECKTAGTEYNKEKNNTNSDGGQLFSYCQQVTSTKWLAIYASDWDGEKITYKSDVIHSEDDANILKLSEKDKSILTYKSARNLEERFAAWEETYGKEWLNNTIFDEESQAYKVGIPPLRKKHLVDFADAQSIINKFEEILRHNNVSDKENAFNRLVALFICKLVDEIEKQDDDEVEFQYKQGTDTYETLQDRLQRLHKRGMDEFMHEELFYVESDYADRLFQQHTGQKRKRAIAELNETIRKLKFYTNNDFAFKDVHNEELFYQNGKILVEVVQLFQPYRVVFSSKNQTLGDLFEGLLNKGFKQNEGQFFTPMPITRFMWDSLPLLSYIEKHGLPRTIDYSCGAAHFLTEGIESIVAAAKEENIGEVNDSTWIQDCIFGIEKDYRLARVSKVSMFMNGAGNANIIFGDGLENYPDKGIKAGAFDVLVANPPYSVQAFKQHLALKNNSLDLLKFITNTGSEIEVLFVERIAQLLKPCGIGAVILPASMLSNGSGCYIKAREELLKNFFIRAMVCFGGNTFGATNTKTVTLFLEKYNEPPRVANLLKDSVDAIMNGDVTDDFIDSDILAAYVQHQGITQDDYLRFVSRDMSFEEIKDNTYLKIYENIKNTVSIPRKATAEEEELIRRTKSYDSALAIERDKLYYFALAYEQHTLVITAPSKSKKQQTFLGYKWSNRRGNEGMQITHEGGKMYDDKNRFQEGTLASAVRKSFTGEIEVLPKELQQYAKTYWLKDLIDFSREKFNKEISTVAKKAIEIKSKYEKVELQNIVDIIKGVTYSKEQQTDEETQRIILTADNITLNGYFEVSKKIYLNTDKPLAESKKLIKGDCFMCFSSGSEKHVGKVCYIGENTNYYAGGFMGILRVKNESCNSYYLSCLLNHKKYRALIALDSTGANINNLSNKIGYVQVPLPPMDIQEQIVKECEAIDDEYNRTRMSIEEYQHKINKIFTSPEVISGSGRNVEFVDLGQIAKSIKKGESITQEQTIEGNYKVVAGGRDFAYTHNKYNREPNVITVSASGAYAGYVNLWKERIFASDCNTIYGKNDTETSFIYFYLKSIQNNIIDTLQTGAAQPHVYAEDIKKIKIPLFPKEILERIVAQCEEYEQKIAEARAVMEGCAARKQAVLDKYLN